MTTITDYLLNSTAAQAGLWIQLTNNATNVSYVSTAATGINGAFTVQQVPAGSYVLSTGASNVGPWFVNNSAYVVANDSPIFNVMDYGAKGDGSTDDTSAIDAAATAAGFGTLFFPKGNFLYNGTGLAMGAQGKWRCQGAGREVTTITLGASSYFYQRTSGGFITEFYLAGITFQGGLGIIRQAQIVSDSSTLRTVTDCTFLNYTGVAICDLGTDTPYWKIDHCFFAAANVTTSMAVAIAGSPEGFSLSECAIWQNRIGVKMAGLGRAANIIDCEFFPATASAGFPRCSIWVVPGAQGSYGGFKINNVKFGSEGLEITDFYAVVADEDATGADFSTHMPLLATESVQWAYHLIFDKCLVVGLPAGADGGPPLLFSTTRNVGGCRIENLLLGGGMRSIVEYLVERGNQYTLANILGPCLPVTNVASWPYGRQPAKNCAGSWTIVDPIGLFESITSIPTLTPGGGSSVGYVNLSQSIGSMTFFNASAVPVTDSLGGTDALEVTIGGSPTLANGLIDSLVTPTAYLPVWVEFDLKQGSSDPMNVVACLFGPNGAGVTQSLVKYQAPTANWVRYRYMRVPTKDVGVVPAHYCFFGWPNPTDTNPSATGTKFQIGRIRIYHAREPIISDLVLLGTATSRIIPGATSFSLRNNANSADNLILTDAGAATFRSTVGGITTLTATTLAGTLSTATQGSVTSVGTLTSLTTSGLVAFGGSTAGNNTAGSLSITANNTPASGGRVNHIWMTGTLTQSTGASTMEQIRLDATLFAGGALGAPTARGLTVNAASWGTSGTAPTGTQAIFITMPTIGTSINAGVSIGTPAAGTWGFYQASAEANSLGGSLTLAADPGLKLTTAASRIIPGATSLSLRNNANSADNLIITDAGAVTVRDAFTAGSATAGTSTFTSATGAAVLALAGSTSSDSAKISYSSGRTIFGYDTGSQVSMLSGIKSFAFSPSALTGTGIASFGLNFPAMTGVTFETPGFVQAAQTITITGGFATQRWARFAQPTLSAATSLTVVNSATVVIDGAPLAAGAGPAIITNSYALWVQAGVSRFDGLVDMNNGVALGGGAAPTVGTIGGSGPATAAQNSWLKVKIAGVDSYIPIWR